MRHLIILILVAALVGCGQRRAHSGKSIPPPPPPPPVPAARIMPLDAELMQAAHREIRAALNSNDEVIRANAIEAIQRSIGEEGAADILAGFGDSSALVRFAAAMASGTLRLEEARQPLLELVSDPDPMVRIGVRFALHRLGDTRYSRDLERTAVDPDPVIRSHSTMVLGLLEEPSALRVLRVLRRDPDAAVRLQAAEAMWRLGDETALPTLVAATVSQHPDDQMLGLLALAGPRDRRVMEHIRGKLVADYEEVALIAARAMGELGSDEGYGVALRHARSNDPRQKALAALAFGAIARSDAQLILSEMLKDPNAAVRLAAATALLQLQE